MMSTVENIEAFLITVQGSIYSGKEVTLWCFCPLYFNYAEESFYVNQRMSLFLLSIPL